MYKEYTHYELNQYDLRIKYNTSGDFDRSRALCGNGSAYAKLTKIESLVDCPACIAKKFHGSFENV